MRREEAIRKIDDLANVVSTSIPEKITVLGREYRIKEDVMHGDREEALIKYAELYEELRRRIREMDDVPEDMVHAALVLRRAVMFLKEFRKSDEIEDKKRWLEYIRKVGV